MSKYKNNIKKISKSKPIRTSIPLTIGIITTGIDNHKISAELYEHIVKYATNTKKPSYKCQKDQDHPPTFHIGVIPQNDSDIENNFKLAKHLGAKFFVVSSAEIDLTKYHNTGLPLLQKKGGESIGSFAKRIVQYSINHKIPIQNEESYGLKKNMEKDIKIDNNLTQYKQKNIVGVIGGAGPLASSLYCKILAYLGKNYIAFHDTTAPDKNNAVLGKGPDFKPYYEKDIELLSSFIKSISMPCNTAHFYQEHFQKFSEDLGINFLDIRDATIQSIQKNYSNSDNKKIILLATPATIEKGLYHKKLEDNKYEIITPDEKQIKEIYKAIYIIKGDKEKLKIVNKELVIMEKLQKDNSCWINNKGKKTLSSEEGDAKELILKVIKEIRMQEKDDKIPVILGCTELPVPFASVELNMYNLISTSRALAIFATKFVSYDYYQTPPSNKVITNENTAKCLQNIKENTNLLY